jgi:hypothetical protein
VVLRRVLAPFVVLVPFTLMGVLMAAATVGAGCASTTSRTSPESNAPEPSSDFSSSGGAVVNTGAAPASGAHGSPLCKASADTCLPDDDGTEKLMYSATSKSCQPPDAGGALPPSAPDASPGLTGVAGACRVNASGSPDCADGVNRQGTDGVACTKPSDCAAGYDCIVGDHGGTCRHYCCSGTCEDRPSRNGGTTFCDIQRLLDNQLTVPVCMPIKKCRLLMPGDCGERETCGVVTETGDTGCVANGDATAGQACDNDHCAAGLTCLGNPGDRRCYTLCKTDGGQCASNQTCTTSGLFQDPSYGVCKDAQR